MNAIEFLINEHDKVRLTLKFIAEKAPLDQTKRQTFDILCQELINHETMEHKIWYPHFKHDKRLSETVKHLLLEERTAEKEIKKFADVQNQQEWEIKFATFKQDIEHHAEEEEQKLFPEVKKLLSKSDLEKIGKEMQEY